MMTRRIVVLFIMFLFVIGCSEDMTIDPITYGYGRGQELNDRSIEVFTCGKYSTVDCKDDILKDSSICKNAVDTIWFKPKWILIDFLNDDLKVVDSLSEVYYGGPITRKNFSQNYWHVKLAGEWMLQRISGDSISDTIRALDTLNRYVDVLIYKDIKVCMNDELAHEKVAKIVKNEKYSLDVAEYMVRNDLRKIYGDSARTFFTNKESLESLFQ